MNRPDVSTPFASSRGMPREADEPVFAEPWQAQAFALAVQLNEAGFFSWQEWADELATVLRDAEARGSHDDGSHYYECWLRALERLCLSKGLTSAPALDRRMMAWADAYRRTPHGRPVELANIDAR